MKKFLVKISAHLIWLIISIILIYIVVSIILLYYYLSSIEDAEYIFVLIQFNIISALTIILLTGLLILKFQISIKTHISNSQALEFKQIESLMNMHSLLKLKMPISTREWAASPDFLNLIFNIIIQNKPNVILEFGSGVSSLYIGHVLKEFHPEGKLISIDHSFEFLEKTKFNINASGLNRYVDVLHCPLKSININGNEFNWYDLNDRDIPMIDILIIDGPISKLNNKIRYPAIPVLINNLQDNAIIVLDDYNRPEEKEIVKDWLSENVELKLVEEINTDKGTAILKIFRG